MPLETMISNPCVHTVAVMHGDGIGVEVTAAALDVLRNLEEDSGKFRLRYTEFDWTTESYLRHGYYIPKNELAEIQIVPRWLGPSMARSSDGFWTSYRRSPVQGLAVGLCASCPFEDLF
jgi:isocitrate/isopropylmalate dehydrogenase